MCFSIKTTKVHNEQNSSNPRAIVGSAFAAGVLKRERQLVLVIRECVTYFTFTKLVSESEHLTDLRDVVLLSSKMNRSIPSIASLSHSLA